MWDNWKPLVFPTKEEIAENELRDVLKNLPEHPRDGCPEIFKISIVDGSGWFQIRFETPYFCATADTDYTMTPSALADLHEVVKQIAVKPTLLFVDFNNEGEGAARMIMSSDASGNTRLTIIDWCVDEDPPRIDIQVPTNLFSKLLFDAIGEYVKKTTIPLDGLSPSEKAFSPMWSALRAPSQ